MAVFNLNRVPSLFTLEWEHSDTLVSNGVAIHISWSINEKLWFNDANIHGVWYSAIQSIFSIKFNYLITI